MNGGGIVATGHEHSYSRTFTLTNLGNAAAGHGKTGVANTVEVGAGRTFVFVSGLAGNSVLNGNPRQATAYFNGRLVDEFTINAP